MFIMKCLKFIIMMITVTFNVKLHLYLRKHLLKMIVNHGVEQGTKNTKPLSHFMYAIKEYTNGEY